MIAAYLLGIVICFGMPIGGFWYVRAGKKGIWKPFWLGMAAFVVSQMVIRIPILNFVLPQFAWFHVMQMNVWGYGLFLGLTAALFEEGARWLVMRFLMKNCRERCHGLAFGLGHGGIEAILIVGLNYLVALVMTLCGSGNLLPFTVAGVFLGSWERFSTILFHTGLSLIILYGVREKKSVRYLTIAVFLHTLTDAACVILPQGYGIGVIPIELFLTVVAVLAFVWGWKLYSEKGLVKEK